MIIKLKYIFIINFILIFFSCTKVEEYLDIDNNVSGPIDIAYSSDHSYFYVLNSDFDRKYNTGSILIIDSNGVKQSSIEVPRLGRSIKIAGDDMLVLFDTADDDAKYEARLYDIGEDPLKPSLKKTWSDLDCVPINSAIYKDYKYFAVTCRLGKLFIGTLENPRENSTLKLVRDYQRTRRALYVDTTRELLFAFTTNVGQQSINDLKAEDIISYDPITKTIKNEPNEVPDDYESTQYKLKSKWNLRSRYQLVVYNIGKEKAPSDQSEPFPFRDIDSSTDQTVQKELRWFYFSLTNSEGAPDDAEAAGNENEHIYRTNFWAARPDPIDKNSFYLSQRGTNASYFSNNILHVTITGDIAKTDPDPLFTSKVLKVTRVYGFGGDIAEDQRHFPGDFDVSTIDGKLTLTVNNFKDMVNFKKDDRLFSIAAKVIDGSSDWSDEIISLDSNLSYYQFAIDPQGKLLSCSFYGSSVAPFKIIPGVGISKGWANITSIQ